MTAVLLPRVNVAISKQTATLTSTNASYSRLSTVDSRTALIEAWVKAAMMRAVTKELDGGYVVAEVPGIPEAWMDAPTADEALAALPDVLFDWAVLELDDGRTDLPVFDGISLNS